MIVSRIGVMTRASSSHGDKFLSWRETMYNNIISHIEKFCFSLRSSNNK